MALKDFIRNAVHSSAIDAAIGGLRAELKFLAKKELEANLAPEVAAKAVSAVNTAIDDAFAKVVNL